MPFSPLLGNARIKAALALRDFGAPVLLEGPAGSGKKTAAFYIACGLLCSGKGSHHPEQGRPCGVCSACVRMRAGTHADCAVLSYDGKAVKIEQVRELRARTFVKPQQADTKVFIIHEADRLSEQCQNALLKVLEEPHSCVFLLTCEESAALLQTVRSRCVTYRMEPLERGELERELKGAGTAKQIAEAVARSGGFLGRARELLEGGEPEYQALAREFACALEVSELELFSLAARAEKLGREEYPLFLDSLCSRLVSNSFPGGAQRVEIYQYICWQREALPHNPGAAALAYALAAHCGRLVFSRKGEI